MGVGQLSKDNKWISRYFVPKCRCLAHLLGVLRFICFSMWPLLSLRKNVAFPERWKIYKRLRTEDVRPKCPLGRSETRWNLSWNLLKSNPQQFHCLYWYGLNVDYMWTQTPFSLIIKTELTMHEKCGLSRNNDYNLKQYSVYMKHGNIDETFSWINSLFSFSSQLWARFPLQF